MKKLEELCNETRQWWEKEEEEYAAATAVQNARWSTTKDTEPGDGRR